MQYERHKELGNRTSKCIGLRGLTGGIESVLCLQGLVLVFRGAVEHTAETSKPSGQQSIPVHHIVANVTTDIKLKVDLEVQPTRQVKLSDTD